MEGMVTKVTDSIRKRVDEVSPPARQAAEKPWMMHLGKLKPLRKETQRINKRIEEAFGQIDNEFWR